MKYLFAFVFIFVLGGCTTKVINVSEYRISSSEIKFSFEQKGCKDNSLKVEQAFSSNKLMSKKMSYIQGRYSQDTFTQSEWAETPNKAITQEIVKYIQDTKLFKTIQVAKSRTKSEILLETNVEEFMQYFSDDEKSSFVKAVLTFTLVNTKTSEIIDSKTFKSEVEVKSLNAKGGVIGLNKALENILNEMGVWLGESCR